MPGESGKIPMLVRTTNLSGPITKSPRVHTNVPGEPPTGVMLKITGQIWQAVEVTPRSANFGRVPMGDTSESALVRKVTVLNNVDTSLNITNLKSSNPAFRLETTVIEPGKKVEISITLLQPLRTGSNYARIDASTGVAEQPTIQFSATAYLSPEVEAAPKQILLTANRTRSTKRYLTIKNSGKEPMVIQEVSVNNPRITHQIQDTANLRIPRATVPGQTPPKPNTGRNFRITLDIPADLNLGPAGAMVSIKTNNPRFPVINVPIKERAAPIARRAPIQVGARPGAAVRGNPARTAPLAVQNRGPASPKGAPAATGAKPRSVFDAKPKSDGKGSER